MTENKIQLKNDNLLKLEIVDLNGESTGEYLTFDLEDIELPLRYQELIEKDKKNKQNIKNQLTIIEKKQDHKGKKLLSANEEAKMYALRDFFKKEEEIYNMFLGENGVKKLLCGRSLGWTTLNEIDKLIVEQIQPRLDLTMNKITDKIKGKYSVEEKEDNALE